jgi:hypothetical protein
MMILGTAVPGTGGAYQIQRSLRFNSADSAYLNRTPASAGNLQTWTWSGWVKRSRLGVDSETIFALFDYLASPTTNKQHGIRFLSGDTIEYWCYQDPSYNGRKITTQVFRDVSSWYHIVAVWDTPNATAANRMRLYVNGSEVTTFGTNTNPTQNSNGEINRAFFHTIGTFYDPDYGSPISSFNGYLTEVNFIDGQALTPSSFGQTNASTGVWEPIKYTGTYGTNGFYLNFSDNSNTTAGTLGKDYSGNGHNWTPNNFSVTAGVGNDSLVDTPTSYGTDTGVGGEVRGNYATLNPLWKGANITLANGNLDASATSLGSSQAAISSIFVSSGKWYFEYLQNADTNSNLCVGIADTSFNATNTYVGSTATTYGYIARSNNKWNNGSFSSYGTGSASNGDVLMCAFDLDNGKIYFGKNGTWYGSGDPVAGTNAAFTGISGTYCPAYSHNSGSSQSTSASFNFGQRPFAYTAPSGFKALCTQNLSTPTIGATSTTQANKYFDIELYTGTGSSRSVTGSPFQPDFVWIKSRSGATDHGLYDAVRGTQNQLESNTTDAATTETTGLTAFNSDGFTVGALAQLNTNTATYVSWLWNAGGSNATNTSGTITSTVRANTTAGFSIITYTGNATQGATVGHGLGVTPAMLIIKARSSTTSWIVQHRNAGTAPSKLLLESTQAVVSSAPEWNNASGTPTAFNSTVFTIAGTGYSVNNSGVTYVAYCFAEVAGYSAFGIYTGNASSDGPFVYTGFSPRWLLIKRTNNTSDWYMYDTSRDVDNPNDAVLGANSSAAESTSWGGVSRSFDILSNGFKVRTPNDPNGSGGTYIYAAFATNPFKYSLAR